MSDTEFTKHDVVARASDPGRFSFSKRAFRRLYGEYFRFFFRKRLPEGEDLNQRLRRVEEHLGYGDTRAAVVVSEAPLRIAAYTDELDCIAMLNFPAVAQKHFGLKVGNRLITSNCYSNYDRVVSDLRPGPQDTRRYQNFIPVIADFFTTNVKGIERRKQNIDDEEFDRAMMMGMDYLRDRPDFVRDGCPFFCEVPGTPLAHVPCRADSGPPDVTLTPAVVEQLKIYLRDNELNPKKVALLLYATGTHPEVFERVYRFVDTSQLGGFPVYEFESQGLHCVVEKASAYAYDEVVFGYDPTRNGVLFTPKNRA